MRLKLTALAALLFLCAAALGCSRQPQYNSIQFGTFTRDGDRLIFRPQTHMTTASEHIIGWAFDIEGSPRRITIREVISGPPGTVWPSVDTLEVTDGGRTVSATAEVENPGPTHLFHNRTLDGSDVVGKYTASLHIDGRLVRSVEFVLTHQQ